MLFEAFAHSPIGSAVGGHPGVRVRKLDHTAISISAVAMTDVSAVGKRKNVGSRKSGKATECKHWKY